MQILNVEKIDEFKNNLENSYTAKVSKNKFHQVFQFLQYPHLKA